MKRALAKNIYESGELVSEATISKMEIVASEGGKEITREVDFYNLDAVIATPFATQLSSRFTTA